MKYNTLRNSFLIVIILFIILLVVFSYIVFLKPGIQGYVVDKQLEARDIVLLGIVQQVQQQGFLQISTEDGNVITLVDQNLCPQIVQQALINQQVAEQ